jgi:hypothetical protein
MRRGADVCLAAMFQQIGSALGGSSGIFPRDGPFWLNEDHVEVLTTSIYWNSSTTVTP